MITISEYQGEESLRNQFLRILSVVDQDFVPALSRRQSLEFWIQLFEKGIILYAIEDETIAGFLAYYPSLNAVMLEELRPFVNINPVLSSPATNKPFQGAYLHFIAVSPEFRGKQVGSGLMTALLEDAQRNGAAKLRVVTWSTNERSLNLYKKHGFLEFRCIDNDRGKGIDSVYLEANIPNFVPLEEKTAAQRGMVIL
ncbi:MAG: GNAT family N-acetyltransferase [Candidatus Thorarchaeota archaeon]